MKNLQLIPLLIDEIDQVTKTTLKKQHCLRHGRNAGWVVYQLFGNGVSVVKHLKGLTVQHFNMFLWGILGLMTSDLDIALR